MKFGYNSRTIGMRSSSAGFSGHPPYSRPCGSGSDERALELEWACCIFRAGGGVLVERDFDTMLRGLISLEVSLRFHSGETRYGVYTSQRSYCGARTLVGREPCENTLIHAPQSLAGGTAFFALCSCVERERRCCTVLFRGTRPSERL